MQAGDDNINRVVYVPFTTMSDLKDTHYLDSIWFNYETSDYERIEQSVRYIMAAQHKFNPADRRALLSLILWSRSTSSRSSPSA
jgi:putative ABC transport system permease protein